MAMTPPTHRLKILNKKTNGRCNDAGVGWLNKDGSISLLINPGITLTENKSELVYTIFPIDKEI